MVVKQDLPKFCVRVTFWGYFRHPGMLWGGGGGSSGPHESGGGGGADPTCIFNHHNLAPHVFHQHAACLITEQSKCIKRAGLPLTFAAQIIIQWCENETASCGFGVTEEHALQVREAAKPFVAWVQEGEER